MNWTRLPELRTQLQKLWDNGALLASTVPRLPHGNRAPVVLFPLRLSLQGPTSTEMVDCFNEVRAWSRELRALPFCRLVMREFKHRQLGINMVPHEVWVDTLEQALAWLGKQKEAEEFALLCSMTEEQQPLLMDWLGCNSMTAQGLAQPWSRFLEIIGWLQLQPRPGVYLRQLDIAGVSPGFVSSHHAVLCELLDIALPAAAVNPHGATDATGFLQRYGFAQKPLRIRFRLLDPWSAMVAKPLDGASDITLDAAAFARLDVQQGSRVFITTSESSFLAFPALRNALVIYCKAGIPSIPEHRPSYATDTDPTTGKANENALTLFEALAQVLWLQRCAVYFWGDIDAASFVLLNHLRRLVNQTQSLLMDRATLLVSETHWGQANAVKNPGKKSGLAGDSPSFFANASKTGTLANPGLQPPVLLRLNSSEKSLYEELVSGRLKKGLYLSQTEIPWSRVLAALAALEENF